jgi:HlyD family secretion protein
MKLQYLSFAALFLLAACKNQTDNFDATGVFEAEEVIISAETTGKLLSFAAEEGSELKAGQRIAEIDCEQIKLQKNQVQATVGAVSQKQNNANPQVQILREQLNPLDRQIETQREQLNPLERQVETQQEQVRVLEKERARLEKLVRADAVPAKQLDDLVGQISVLQKQIAATESQKAVLQKQIAATESQKSVIAQQMRSQQEIVAIQNRGIMSEQKPIEERVPLYDDQLRHCSVIAPFNGTVLLTYAKANEIAAIGKPLFKMANLDTLTLRAYISGNQFSQAKLNQSVKVLVDDGAGKYRELTGKLIWIANKAEFTPKTIQTKDERANLVYAIKIRVPNDGSLKIGMYGEVQF